MHRQIHAVDLEGGLEDIEKASHLKAFRWRYAVRHISFIGNPTLSWLSWTIALPNRGRLIYEQKSFRIGQTLPLDRR